ncbi:hypothetical protein Lgra_1341 [Legionella gratiana]|uniref:Uncharacterized protein n=1 Tax=Legionella gratiana TaxID=45066 RepID=A0A378JFX0_9GAMM|nr:hypothetical protein [Legionella gratiana]KTD11883.1 hypothetical protein Lgra_1341 [Legionella gratiana]STX46525.1 Uncharacterised protein [Legionella gratiana]
MGSYGCAEGKCPCPCHKHEGCHDSEHHHCHHGGHHPEDKATYFLKLADEAWEEVLKEKIKEYILDTQNTHMVKLAKIVAEGNHHRWQNRMENKQACDEFMDEIRKFFSKSKK